MILLPSLWWWCGVEGSGEPGGRTFPTSFRVELLASAEAAVEPARTRILDL